MVEVSDGLDHRSRLESFRTRLCALANVGFFGMFFEISIVASAFLVPFGG
jgi:hypothetical protein